MTARMTSPVLVLPDALPALLAVSKSASRAGLPRTTALLVHLRVSQINGCAVCVDMHAGELRELGETDQRLFGVSAWRDAPWFTDAERAALDLAESATRLADNPDAVPDAIWDGVRAQFETPALAALIMEIAMINTWNRINAITRQEAGRDWSADAQQSAETAAA